MGRGRHEADVVVVGGGAGGLTAATRAARRGASVALVADGPLGGECTHTGCVPSKTLLTAAAEGRDFDDAMAVVRSTIERVAATEDEATMARHGVMVVRGRASLATTDLVRIDGVDWRAGQIVLATGSRPALPPVPGLAEAEPLTNETVFELDRLPARLAVIGGGPTGCELAQAFARLGSDVTLIEADSRLLPSEDRTASELVAAALSTDGVDVRSGVAVERVDGTSPWCLRLAEGADLEVDHVLVVAGRRPVTEGLGLEAIGVEVDADGRIVVDDRCATNVAGVWAVGDVTDAGGLTHVAGRMGFVAATNATRSSRLRPAMKFDRGVVPRVVFTDPEVAAVGMSESEAAAAGGRVAEVHLDRVDRGITSGRTDGYVKLFAGPRPVLRSLGGGRLLGASIVGPRAGELIAEVALAMRTRMFTGRLAQTPHAYPTWSMAVEQAATGFFAESDGVVVRSARR